MILPVSMVVAFTATTMIGLVGINTRDVEFRRGQLVADAVVLAGVVGGPEAADETARRNGATLSSMEWSADDDPRLTVFVVDNGRTFRADASGG